MKIVVPICDCNPRHEPGMCDTDLETYVSLMECNCSADFYELDLDTGQPL